MTFDSRAGRPRMLLRLGLFTALLVCVAATASGEDALRRAQLLAEAGDPAAALALVETLEVPDAALLRVDLLRRLGRLTRAERALSELQAGLVASSGASAAFRAGVYRQTALLYSQRGESAAAGDAMRAALAPGDRLPAALHASILNDAAVIHQRNGDMTAAIAQFRAAVERAGGGADAPGYRINAARALLEDGQLQASLSEAEYALRTLKQRTDPSDVRYRIALAGLYRHAVNEFGADVRYRLSALELLQGPLDDEALPLRVQSLLNGHVAQLYFDDARFDAARFYARSALRSAAQAQAQDLEYRWEWVLAQAFAELGEIQEATAAYARAITSLARVRSNLETFDRGTLDQVIKPLYYEYADLLLRQGSELDGADKQRLLGDARAALEELKVAEVQDYFNEQCVGDERVLLDRLAVNTVVLYPVLLKDRLELLMTTETGIQQIAVAVERGRLIELVRDFRLNLEANTGSGDFLRQAQQLYDLIIRPLEPELARHRVDTLVFVPDGPLRTIPLAALHDGDAWLVERYALATSPGVTLTQPRPLARRDYPTLAGGLSESVQGFPALPGVERELSSLARMLDAQVLENRAFTLDRVQSELQSGKYSIVHLATHGQFRGSYEDSFLLTYDDRLRINELGRNIQSRDGTGDPLELLVLSACETAAGDDRAALGLAGVALRAGARSALATLWEVDDRAALEIVQAFYMALSDGSYSRAQSLRRAQLQLIGREGSSHPSLWAPFLLIGDWL